MSFSSSFVVPDLSSTSSFAGNVTRAVVDPCNLPPNLRTLDEGLFCLFNYAPNIELPIAGIVIFALLFILHLVLNIRSKSLLMVWITATVALEVGGYISKVLVVESNPANGYLAMTILLVTSPNLLALVNYTMLGKLIAIGIGADESLQQGGLQQTSSPQASSPSKLSVNSSRIKRILLRDDGRIQPLFISVFFLLSDLASLTVQSIAASYLTNKDPNKRLTGEHIMTGGRAIPLFFLRSLPSLRVWIGLLATMVLLGLRNIYRFLEYAMGAHNWVASSEPMFYEFDALMIISSLIIYAYSDFGRLLPLAQEQQIASLTRKNPCSVTSVELEAPVVKVLQRSTDM